MKQTIFLLLAAGAFFLPGCRPDPYALDMERFDVYWSDNDQSGTRTPADDLEFVIRASTTNPNADQQYITKWELSYEVNGAYGGIIQSDENAGSNSINVDAIVGIDLLKFPGGSHFKPGDLLQFNFFVTDNQGVSLERQYNFRLE